MPVVPPVPPEPPSGSGSGGPLAWDPPPPAELQRLLPKYGITSLLGRGGMGAVYEGRQLSLDRPVAVKILSAALEGQSLGFAERFKNEARAMAKLNHPGIVAVHDFGEAAGSLCYIVMEFVGGTDVAKMIAEQGRLHTDHAMAIIAHVCDALAYAHERGIIHRDIKPANIMVGYDGVVKVADFGLAKMTQGESAGVTQSGLALGSLHYMAPESMIYGTEVDHRADIFALGVMLYHMLTGKVPRGLFAPPSQQIPGLDPRYDSIIHRAIQNDREKRYPSVNALRAELDNILTAPVPRVEATNDDPVAAVPAALPTRARPKRRKVAPPPLSKRARFVILWGTITASLVLVIGMAWLFIESRESGPKPADPTLSGPTPDPVKTPVAIPMTRVPWPTGPNFRSAGHFRSWSSLPNDGAIALTGLEKINSVKQVHMRGGSGWVVLQEDGTVVALDKRVETTGVRRICPGYADWFALLTTDGKLRACNRVEGFVDDPELAKLPPVQDAYVAPFHRVALLEDGSLRVWGKAHDGVQEKGNPEWKVKPAVPAGKKAVALSSSDASMAVKLDDGSLLVWTIDQGVVTLPAEFTTGRIGNFAIFRGRLFTTTPDGSGAISWDLSGKAGPPEPVGGGRRITDFIQTGVGMLARTDAGGIVDFFLRKACPGIADAVPKIGPTSAEHLSLSLPYIKDVFDARLIWFDEGPVPEPVPATVANPDAPVPIDWPPDGPNFRRIDQFKVWSSRPNQKNLDLNKLRGITDVVQVYHGRGNWVVLRANGDTISSHDDGDRKGIRRICPGNHIWYALISEDGSVEVISPEADKSHLRPPDGLKAIDGFVSPSCFALTTEGQIEVWGRNFDGKKEEKNGEWAARPTLPSGTKAIAITHTEFILGAQLEDHSLLVWNPAGAMRLPRSLSDLKFDSIAAAGANVYGVVSGTHTAVTWKKGLPEPTPIPDLPMAKSVLDTGSAAVCFLTESGKPVVVSSSDLDPAVLSPVLPYIDGADPSLISLRFEYVKATKESYAYLLWYDGSIAKPDTTSE